MTSLAYLHDCHCCYNERSNVQKKKTFVVSLLDAIGLANTPHGTLWETAGRILCLYLACTVVTLIQNLMHLCFF